MASNSWELLGDKLYGEILDANFGFSISSNDDGNIIAISAPYNGDGIVKIYKLNPSTNQWDQYGQTLTSSFTDKSKTKNDLFGYSVHLNGDASGLIIGAAFTSLISITGILEKGTAECFTFNFNNNQWEKKGQTIEGDADSSAGSKRNTNLGWDCLISNDNNKIVISSPFLDRNSKNSNNGFLKIYRFNSSTNQWQMKYEKRADKNDSFSYSISGNSDLTKIVSSCRRVEDNSNIWFAILKVTYNSNLSINTIEKDYKRTIINKGDLFITDVAMSSNGNNLAVATLDQNSDIQIQMFNVGDDANATDFLTKKGNLVTLAQTDYNSSGSTSYEDLKLSIDINNNGDNIIFGFSNFEENNSTINIGAAFLLNYENPNWSIYKEFKGQTSDELYGYAVNMSNNGEFINIGSIKYDGNSINNIGLVENYCNIPNSYPLLNSFGYNTIGYKDIGFTASQLISLDSTTHTISVLSSAYNPTELLNAGFARNQIISSSQFSATELKNIGYTATELKNGGYTASDLKTAEFTVSDLKDEFTILELKNGGFRPSELELEGFSISDLKTNGFTISDFVNDDYTISDLKNDFTTNQLRSFFSFTFAQIKSNGISATKMKNDGIPLSNIDGAGYTVNQLRSAGFLPKELKNLNSSKYSIDALKNGGFEAIELKDDFETSDLFSVFNENELFSSGVKGRKMVKYSNSTYTPTKLENIGYTENEIINSFETTNLISYFKHDKSLSKSDIKSKLSNKIYTDYNFSNNSSNNFGMSFDLNKAGDMMVIGEPNYNSSTSSSNTSQGKILIYRKNIEEYFQLSEEITVGTTPNHIGFSVSTNNKGDKIVFSDNGYITTSQNENSKNGNNACKVYIYQSTLSNSTYTWSHLQTIDFNSTKLSSRQIILYLAGNNRKLIINEGTNIKRYQLNPANNLYVKIDTITTISDTIPSNSENSISVNVNCNYIIRGNYNNKCRILSYNSSSNNYISLGSDIDGTGFEDFGKYVKISNDGKTVAISAIKPGTSYSILIYKYSFTNIWILKKEIKTDSPNKIIGREMILSDNGNLFGFINDTTNSLIFYKFDTSSGEYNEYTRISTNITGKSSSNSIGIITDKILFDYKFENLYIATNGTIFAYKYKHLNNISIIKEIEPDIKNVSIGDLINKTNNEFDLDIDLLKKSYFNKNLSNNNLLHDQMSSSYINDVLTTRDNISDIKISVPSNSLNNQNSLNLFFLTFQAKNGDNNVLFSKQNILDGAYFEGYFPSLDTTRSYYVHKVSPNTNNLINSDENGYPVLLKYNSITQLWYTNLPSFSDISISPSSNPCFYKDVKILCYNRINKNEFYKKVQDIKVNEFVKTFGTPNQYSRVIYTDKILFDNDERIQRKRRLFQHKIHKDIIVSGIHSMLYKNEKINDDLYSLIQNKVNWSNEFMKVGDKLKVLAYLDPNFKLYDKVNDGYIYLIGIESENDELSYGLYLEHKLYAETTAIKAIDKIKNILRKN